MSTSTATTYTLCDSCAGVAANADTSGISDSDQATVEAFFEMAGNLAATGTTDPGGYWRCPSCGYDQIGTGHTWETI